MKKGFTLIEIISVMVVLAIIAMIVSPAIFKAIQTSKEKSYNTQVNNIVEAAKSFMINNNNLLKDDGSVTEVSVATLIEKNYIKNSENGKLKNPKEKNTYMDGCVRIYYSFTNNQYIYEYNDTCSN